MSVERLLQVARSQIGTVERPPGSNRQPYGDAYGMPGVAWCAQFVWWCFREAGLSDLIPKTAYTPSFADWFRSRGQWGSEPRVGAIPFFDFPNDGVNRISHVGIAEAPGRDGTVITIEGNTSSGQAGSQRDGGGVWRRTRRAGIVGYGYPAYGGAATPAPPAPKPQQLAVRPGARVIRRGDRGTDVAFVQRYLGLTDDGIFGGDTDAKVRRYQTMRGLTADGVVGPATWRSMGQ